METEEELRKYVDSCRVENGIWEGNTFNEYRAAILGSTMFGFIAAYEKGDKVQFFCNGRKVFHNG